jgi:hypothetical protein
MLNTTLSFNFVMPGHSSYCSTFSASESCENELGIGIGGSLATPPLHTTVHTGPYTAVHWVERERFFFVRARGSDSGHRRVGFGSFEQRRLGFTLSRRSERPATWIFNRMASSRFPYPSVFSSVRAFSETRSAYYAVC